ncbi:MAG: hypothetical protein ACRDGT_03235 [Candidatus Limnocylindria bacterium]
MEPRVAFNCVAPAHQAGEGGPDKLTVHEGQWAYCAFDARSDDHDWHPTEGLTLTMLRSSALARAKEQAKGPRTA